MRLSFFKYEGLGNDFVLIETEALGGLQLSTDQAVALCDRHRGIGADGILLLDSKSPSMGIINADGSVPEMCGNGIRCAALHLARRADKPMLEVTIDTLAGPHWCRVVNEPGAESVAVRMAPPSLTPSDLPLQSETPWLDHPLSVAERTVRFTGVSFGNPHAVTFDDLGDERFEVGPAIQADSHFPEGVNVGFVSNPAPDGFRLDVLERGAGWTLACGTGACAAAVAAVETGRARRDQPLHVRLPGGTLRVTVGAPGQPVLMEGPARFVFVGEVEL